MTPLHRKRFKSFILRAFLEYHTSFEQSTEAQQSYVCVENKSIPSLRKVVFTCPVSILGGI